MTAKKTPVVQEEILPEPQVDIAAMVAEQVARALKEQAGPEVPWIHCTSCWRRTGPGYAAPFYDSHGVCSECQRSGHGPNPDRCICVRLNFPQGNFVAGAATNMSRAAGVPIENLLREELYTQEDLAALWDQVAEGRYRPKTPAEKSKVELTNNATTAGHKLKSLNSRLENQRGQVAKLLEEIAKTEADIVQTEGDHKGLLSKLGVE